jgi:hypothetical protein
MSYQGNNPQLTSARKLDTPTFNGIATTFALMVLGVPISTPLAEQLIISLNGVLQEPNVAYTVSGGNIIFNVAPISTDTFFGVVFGITFTLVNALQRSGDTMGGDLVLVSSTPATSLSAASKGYVDTGLANKIVALPVTVVTGTTQTGVHWNHYIMTNGGACTFTLPASPSSGDTVWVSFTNGLTTNIIARNGQTIMGVSEDMTVDTPSLTIELRFVSSSWRFV